MAVVEEVNSGGEDDGCDGESPDSVLVSLRRAQERLMQKCDDVEAAWQADHREVSQRLLAMEHALRTGLATAEAERRVAVDQANMAFQKQAHVQQQDKSALMSAISQINESLECVSRKVLQSEAVASECVSKAVSKFRELQDSARSEMEQWSQDLLHQSSLLAAQQRALSAVERALHGQQTQLQEIRSDVQTARTQADSQVSEAMAKGISAVADGWYQQLSGKFDAMCQQVSDLADSISKVDPRLTGTGQQFQQPPLAPQQAQPRSSTAPPRGPLADGSAPTSARTRPTISLSPLPRSPYCGSPCTMSPSAPTASPSPVNNGRRRWRESAPPQSGGSAGTGEAGEADNEGGVYRWPLQRATLVLPPPPRQELTPREGVSTTATRTPPSPVVSTLPAGPCDEQDGPSPTEPSPGAGSGGCSGVSSQGVGLANLARSLSTPLQPQAHLAHTASSSEAESHSPHPAEALPPLEVFRLGPPVLPSGAQTAMQGVVTASRAGAATCPVPHICASNESFSAEPASREESAEARIPVTSRPAVMVRPSAERLVSHQQQQWQPSPQPQPHGSPSMCIHGRPPPPSVASFVCGGSCHAGSHQSAPPTFHQRATLPSKTAVPPLQLQALRRSAVASPVVGGGCSGAGGCSSGGASCEVLSPAVPAPPHRSPYLSARHSMDSSRISPETWPRSGAQGFMASPAPPRQMSNVSVHPPPRVLPFVFASPVPSSVSPRMRYGSVPVSARSPRSVA